jgi:cell shape-determining protein MreD
VHEALQDLLEDVVYGSSIGVHCYPMIISCSICLELSISLSNLSLEIYFLIAFLAIVGTARDGLRVCINEESQVRLY